MTPAATFDLLYARHASLVLGWLTLRCGDDAEDLAQTVWLKVWRALPNSRVDGTGQRWVMMIAKNLLINHHRYKSLRPSVSVEVVPRLLSYSIDGWLDARQELVELRPAIADLTERQRGMVQMALMGERRTNSQRVALYRARTALRERRVE